MLPPTQQDPRQIFDTQKYQTQLPVPITRCLRCSNGGYLVINVDRSFIHFSLDLECIMCNRTMAEWRKGIGWFQRYFPENNDA